MEGKAARSGDSPTRERRPPVCVVIRAFLWQPRRNVCGKEVAGNLLIHATELVTNSTYTKRGDGVFRDDFQFI